MKDLLTILKTIDPAFAATIAPAILIIILFSKVKKIKSYLNSFVGPSGVDTINVINLILDESLASMSRRNQLIFMDLRSRRKQLIEETSFSIYMFLSQKVDKNLCNSEEAYSRTDPEKKLFDAVLKNLLSGSEKKINRYFETSSILTFSDLEYRLFLDDWLNSLKRELQQNFYNSYPTDNLILSKRNIEKIVRENKGEIKDSFYALGFKVLDLEKDIDKKLKEEKDSFRSYKEKIFKDFLLKK